MKWYLAKLVYRIICGEGTHTPQFEEQLRLIEATTKNEAFRKAKVMGRNEEVQFRNEKQELVQWKFIDVSDLYRLNEVVDGTEVYSRIEEKDNAAQFEDIVRKKSAYLQDELNTPHLQQI
jgi:hypothetical protein